MCGIFAYLNHLTPKTRKEILDLLIKGLQRLEYRGYDSAGVGVDGPTGNSSISVSPSLYYYDLSDPLSVLAGEIHR